MLVARSREEITSVYCSCLSPNSLGVSFPTESLAKDCLLAISEGYLDLTPNTLHVL